ncbi:FAD-dependent oxidoreductase [Pseudonocardia xinjiangensis]|uniref:FAD-dependent oxidoreductase n=1 Tax=Pseudonocardia xinjiangensis TaxID=75289 RepID=UPI003D8BF071
MPAIPYVPAPRRTPRSARTGVVDVVVVGGGVVGAAAAWQLAGRGREVLLLEQSGTGRARGVTYGSAEIYRQTYAAEPHVRLAAAALPLWREVEAQTGAALLQITGGVDHGDPWRTRTIAESLAARGVAHEWLDGGEASRRWPGMVFSGPVLHQPDRAGRVHAGHAVAALTAAAVAHGAVIQRSTPATAIAVRGDDLVEVGTPRGPVRARRAVVAVGAGTADLLAGLVTLPPLRVTQEQVANFPLLGGAGSFSARPAPWPTFIHHTGPEDGWPSSVRGTSTGEGSVKLGFHDVGPEQGQPRRLQEYVAAFLPGLDHRLPQPIGCIRTSTPDGSFLLDTAGPLVVGAGFSNHGFTFAPALGRVLADLATGVPDREPMAALRWEVHAGPRSLEPRRGGGADLRDQPSGPAAQPGRLTRPGTSARPDPNRESA